MYTTKPLSIPSYRSELSALVQTSLSLSNTTAAGLPSNSNLKPEVSDSVEKMTQGHGLSSVSDIRSGRILTLYVLKLFEDKYPKSEA